MSTDTTAVRRVHPGDDDAERKITIVHALLDRVADELEEADRLAWAKGDLDLRQLQDRLSVAQRLVLIAVEEVEPFECLRVTRG